MSFLSLTTCSRTARPTYQLWSLPRLAVVAVMWLLASLASMPAAADLIELPAPPSYPGEMQTQAREGTQAIDDKKVEQQKSNSYNLSLEGAYGYTVSGGTVNIRADKVANNRSYGTSGTIKLELWALASPYSGGYFTGYKLGQTTLGTLDAGGYYYGIDNTVTQLVTLPAGTWYMSLMVTEYTNNALNSGYSVIDWGNFSTPWVIGAPPSARVTVYELYNTSTNHYFRTASPEEVAGIAAGSAGPGWIRTWDDFSAYVALGGATGNDVCRFYSYTSNSHFYTASDVECNGLRYTTNEWKYEGLSFRIPMSFAGGPCGTGQKPVYRLYNNRYMYQDSNHRFTTSVSEVDRLRGYPPYWVYEGVAFCALN